MALNISDLFGRRESVALDIGSNSIKLVQMGQAKKGWRINKLGMKTLPPEAIVDGSIIDSMTVISAIKELLKEQGVKAKDAVSSLTGHSVIIKKVSLPAASEDELAESIQWEAEQYIPFPITEVNIDFQILGVDAEGRGQMDVMLVAVKKDVINDYTTVIKEAGLNPVVIDVDAFALENMMEINYPAVAGEMTAIVNIGASITSFSILAEGVTTFTRSIPMGGNQFTEEIQRELSISFAEAEALKTAQRGEGEDPRLEAAIDAISQNLTADIKRSLDFFFGGAEDMSVNKIYLCGGGAKVKGLGAMMQEKTQIPVEMVDPFRNVEMAGGPDPATLKEMAPHFAVAVGLGTRRFGDR